MVSLSCVENFTQIVTGQDENWKKKIDMLIFV